MPDLVRGHDAVPEIGRVQLLLQVALLLLQLGELDLLAREGDVIA